ncbi:uncharacterized protein LOC144542932 [Centroberyx gerrardi]
MNKFLCTCVALAALFVTVESLICNTCDFDLFGACFKESTVNCSKAQTNCYVGEAKFNVTELLSLYARGCIEPAACVNQTGIILTTSYSVTRTCCSSDRCNGASSIQLPLTAALGAAMVAVWSTWDH